MAMSLKWTFCRHGMKWGLEELLLTMRWQSVYILMLEGRLTRRTNERLDEASEKASFVCRFCWLMDSLETRLWGHWWRHNCIYLVLMYEVCTNYFVQWLEPRSREVPRH